MRAVRAIAEKSVWQRRWTDVGLPLGLGMCAAVLVMSLLAILPRLSPAVGLTAAVLGGIVIGGAGQQRSHGHRRRPRTDRWAGALPPGYRILHDVDLRGSIAEHVVIAPTGVWVIATPKQRGAVEITPQGITVDGRRLLRDPRRPVQAAAAAVRTRLQQELGIPVRVSAVVCFPRATLAARTGGTDVPVLDWARMVASLRRGPQSLSAASRARVRLALLRDGERGVPARIRLAGGAAATAAR
jgi:Nuclease-related domain